MPLGQLLEAERKWRPFDELAAAIYDHNANTWRKCRGILQCSGRFFLASFDGRSGK